MPPYSDYLELPFDELLLQLGAQSMASVTSMGATDAEEADELVRGAMEGGEEERQRLIAFGRRVLKRLSKKLHSMVCGGASADIAGEMEAALNRGKVALASFLSALLSSAGVPVPVAVLVASALSGALCDAVFEELCETWSVYNGGL